MKPLERDNTYITTASMIFVAVSSLAYALTSFAQLNVSYYYPQLRAFSPEVLPNYVAMGQYGRFFSAILFGFIGIAVYGLLRPLIKKFNLLHVTHAIVMMSTAFWTAVAIVMVEEWTHWVFANDGIGARYLNQEFLLLFIALLILFFGLLFNAGFEHRIRAKTELHVSNSKPHE